MRACVKWVPAGRPRSRLARCRKPATTSGLLYFCTAPTCERVVMLTGRVHVQKIVQELYFLPKFLFFKIDVRARSS